MKYYTFALKYISAYSETITAGFLIILLSNLFLIYGYRKDKRTKIQATQQSKMIKQRAKDEDAIDFEDDEDLMGMDELFNGI